MTDYTHGTGTSATMMIRDTGITIEFWITSNNSSTWTDHLPWGGTVNGSSVGGSYYYHAGSGWNKLGAWNVWTSQNVTFSIGSTGTSGFGGPTSFTVFLNRASRPSAPSAPVISNIQATSVDAAFTDGSNNGATIDSRLIAYGATTDLGSATQVSSDGSTTITGLAPGVKYYFWAATHNSQGWSDWSARSEALTYRVPDSPTAPTLSDITQVSASVSWSQNYDGGSLVDHYDLAWTLTNTLPTAANLTGIANSPQVVTGLTPGTTYYFWARAHNAYGNSPWSNPTVMKTIAGAKLLVGAVWKDAVPYVRVAGVWKVARPWAKVAGVWKETT